MNVLQRLTIANSNWFSIQNGKHWLMIESEWQNNHIKYVQFRKAIVHVLLDLRRQFKRKSAYILIDLSISGDFWSMSTSADYAVEFDLRFWANFVKLFWFLSLKAKGIWIENWKKNLSSDLQIKFCSVSARTNRIGHNFF